MIKVLVVDDSAFMRKAISTMLENDSGIRVVGMARDGEEGLELTRKLNPDVITMDIEMPRMDGLTALRHVMMEMPRPVLMVSSLTTEGAQDTLRAMELGAVDYIPKQLSRVSLDIIKIEDDLIAKVKSVARRKVFRPSARPRPVTAKTEVTKPAPSVSRLAVRRDVIAVGVSTGGPPAVQSILSALPKNFPAGIVIAQHMPMAFTGPFAQRLDGVCNIRVKEAEHGETFMPGTAYIAPGGRHTTLKQRVSHIELQVGDQPSDALYKPSANVLLESVAEAVGRRGLGVILTGMGNDGCEGIARLRERGGRALTQSDETCVVYGMPKAVVEAGLSDQVVDLDDMPRVLLETIYQ
ncbi:two-component system, chemotaxis family, response regulator CheB [Paucidesulfovibrio gracilis DSM 16080]|uniref:Protein-glutamate methylesterase/protein-glutamine glutaminase n=1 Tax=Paucidesulfovibrio gracilis DSM 16080 TaxID=1121449 RepID=A0A1T4XYQ8_9BACT|nr:chemotaxis response regulator protein-glutamate methylesterase [Paucidesulfovibrio gracilis]SKA94185.1 two-component system, chemotaxis family, response regulator CheB [Paucidesulfovibrio gracilis DSM 16080]